MPAEAYPATVPRMRVPPVKTSDRAAQKEQAMLTELQRAHTGIDVLPDTGDNEARAELPRAKVNALPKWRLRRVQQHIATHFERSISLSELANVVGLSRMHFAAQFRAATGYRPREYLLIHRIEHAKSLLTTTQRPLAEIALAVGFSTQAHFSTVFKRISGQTPARWRAAAKTEPVAREIPLRHRLSPDAGWTVDRGYADAR